MKLAIALLWLAPFGVATCYLCYLIWPIVLGFAGVCGFFVMTSWAMVTVEDWMKD
jgi:hypothetical protein